MLLQIQNFQRVSSAELELKGLSIIRGDSNLGKSSVKRAFESVVFGTFKLGSETDKGISTGYIKKGEKESKITLTIDNDVVTLNRSASKNQYTVNGIELPKGGRGVPEEVRLLGFDKLGKSSDTNLNVASQHSPLFIIGENESSITKNINSVFKVKIYEVATTKIQKRVKDQLVKNNILQTQMVDLQEELNQLKELQEILVQLSDYEESVDLIKRYLSASRDINSESNDIEGLKNILELINKYSLLSEYLSALESNGKDNEDILQLNSLITNLELYDTLEEYLYLKNNLQSLTTYKNLVGDLTDRLTEMESLYTCLGLNKEVSTIESDVNRLSSELSDVQKILIKYTCKTCGQIIHKSSH